MRPIDADEITATLEIAISMMENTKSIIGVENLPVIDVEIKAYTDILKGIKEQPTVQPEERTEKRTETHGVCLDAISRQQAIDAIVNCTNCGDEKTLRAYVAKHHLDNGWTGGVLEAIDAIEDLPSAQPEREEGEWIPVHPIQGDDPGAYMCSKCKTGMWEIRPSAYHYCPNCGARMTTQTK